MLVEGVATTKYHIVKRTKVMRVTGAVDDGAEHCSQNVVSMLWGYWSSATVHTSRPVDVGQAASPLLAATTSRITPTTRIDIRRRVMPRDLSLDHALPLAKNVPRAPKVTCPIATRQTRTPGGQVAATPRASARPPLRADMALIRQVCRRAAFGWDASRLPRLDLDVLREAHSRLLSEDDEDGYFVSSS